MFKLVLEKAEEPEIKLPTSDGSSTKQESSRKSSISALLTMLYWKESFISLLKNFKSVSLQNKTQRFQPSLQCHFQPFFLRSISVQFSRSVMSDSVTPWITVRQTSLSITNSRSSLRLTSIKSVMPSSHLNFCHPLLLLPPIPPSIRVFSNESSLRMRWPKYWSFSFSISSSKWTPRTDLI